MFLPLKEHTYEKIRLNLNTGIQTKEKYKIQIFFIKFQQALFGKKTVRIR
jgi:hypothetical protein